MRACVPPASSMETCVAGSRWRQRRTAPVTGGGDIMVCQFSVSCSNISDVSAPNPKTIVHIYFKFIIFILDLFFSSASLVLECVCVVLGPGCWSADQLSTCNKIFRRHV